MGLMGGGWVILLFGVVFLVIVFVFVYVIGWCCSVGEFVLVFFVGLGIVVVFWMSLIVLSLIFFSV